MKLYGRHQRRVATPRFVLTLINILLLGVAMAGGEVWAQSARSASAATPAVAAQAPVTVLTAHPVVHALALAVSHDSGLVIERAAPANLPPTRMASYFAGRGATQLARAAVGADAVIDLRSIWYDDPLYPLARRSNIRIVEIDAARPVDGALPGVALQLGAQVGAYPWLDPVNLGRMADIITADLERLSPAAKPMLQANLAAFKRRLVTLTAEAETQFSQLEDVSVASLSDRLDYLVSGFNLDMAVRDARADEDWGAQALDDFGDELKTMGVTVVVHHREPVDHVRQAIAAAGAQVVVLDTEQDDPVTQLETMVQALERGFQKE